MNYTGGMLGLNLLIGAGAIQGLLLALLLLALAVRRSQSQLLWLSGFVAALSLVVLGDVLLQTKAILELPYLYQLFDALILALGPLCYGYVRAMIGHKPWQLPMLVLHFLPFVMLQSLLLPDFFAPSSVRRETIMADLEITASEPSLFLVAIGMLTLSYLLRCIFVLRRYWSALEAEYSNAERYKMRWLVHLLCVCAALWSLWMISLIFLWNWADLLGQFGVAVSVYVMGYAGLNQPQLWNAQRPSPSAELEQEGASPLASTTSFASSEAQLLTASIATGDSSTQAPPKYAKTGISQEALTQIGVRLTELMSTEMPFLEPELSLHELASRLQISSHTLSQTLNVHLEQSFFEYVNSWRIKEVQRCFADPAFDKLSILEIALASGFASKATFNATFKRISGLTPSSSRALLRCS